MRNMPLLFVLGLGIAGGLPTARADTILVPEEVELISTALGMAGAGDTISVAPGSYGGNLIWPAAPGIKLLSRTARDAVISTTAEGPAISIQTPQDTATVIDAFIIINGSGVSGGGILCQNTSPTIRNNFLTGNTASSYGGGICCISASPLILGNLLQDNHAGEGGGIYWDADSSPTVEADSIIGCEASRGSGIFCLGQGLIRSCRMEYNYGAVAAIDCAGPVIIEGCCLVGNFGRGIRCEGSPIIRGNLIRENTDGGLYIARGSTALVEGNTIEDHIAGDGAGIYSLESSPTIRSNIIRRNDSQGGLAGGIYIHHGSPLIEHNQITQNNTNYEASGVYCCADSSLLRYNVISDNTCDQVAMPVGSGLFI